MSHSVCQALGDSLISRFQPGFTGFGTPQRSLDTFPASLRVRNTWSGLDMLLYLSAPRAALGEAVGEKVLLSDLEAPRDRWGGYSRCLCFARLSEYNFRFRA